MIVNEPPGAHSAGVIQGYRRFGLISGPLNLVSACMGEKEEAEKYMLLTPYIPSAVGLS
jgi:hypothetical protein